MAFLKAPTQRPSIAIANPQTEYYPIESGAYLHTSPLLKDQVTFPVSAALPSAGGGVFRRDKASSGLAVFVKTARDACDGSTWNSGTLHQHSRNNRQKLLEREHLVRLQNMGAFRETVEDQQARGKMSKLETNIDLAKVYRKEHLEIWPGDCNDNELMQYGSDQNSIADTERFGLEQIAQSSERDNQQQRKVPGHIHHRNSSALTKQQYLPRSSRVVEALMNGSTHSSSELLSSLTTDNSTNITAASSLPYKCITSLGQGLPPMRPESMRSREKVKAILTKLESGKRSSWADLHRDTEYVRRYDPHAIPGLEVGIVKSRH